MDFIQWLINRLGLSQEAALKVAKDPNLMTSPYYQWYQQETFTQSTPGATNDRFALHPAEKVALGPVGMGAYYLTKSPWNNGGIDWQSYGQELKMMLAPKLQSGEITYEQANQFIAGVEQQIKKGTPANQLPFMNEIVNKYMEQSSPSDKPAIESMMGNLQGRYSPVEIYSAQARDYFNAKVGATYEGIGSDGKVKILTYSQADANDDYTLAMSEAYKGGNVESLPFYDEIRYATGENTSKLMNQVLNPDTYNWEEKYKQELASDRVGGSRWLEQNRTLQSAQARSLPSEMTSAKYQDIFNQGPEFPSSAVYNALQGLSPNQKNYFGSRLNELTAEFEMKNPGVREDWWKRKTAYDTANEQLRNRANLLEESPNASAYADEIAGIQSELSTREQNQPGGDPLETWYKKYPFLNRWNALTPQERGYSSQRFRRSTRFI